MIISLFFISSTLIFFCTDILSDKMGELVESAQVSNRQIIKINEFADLKRAFERFRIRIKGFS